MKTKFLISASLFLASANAFSYIYIDKIFFAAAMLYIYVISNKKYTDYVALIMFSLLMLLINLFYIDSTLDVKIILFYLYFCIFIFFNKNYQLMIDSIYYALISNLVVGIFLFFYSFATGHLVGVESLWAKGLPNVLAAKGLGTTPQVFSSFGALLLLIISLNKEVKTRKFFFIKSIPLISILLSINRVWILFYALNFLRNNYKLFLPIVILLIIYYFDFLFFSGTVSSRIKMISMSFDFFMKLDLNEKFFGYSSYDGSYFYLDGNEFSYLESGPIFIILKFGILGLISYFSLCTYCLYKFFKVSKKLFIFSIYYVFFVQTATHEFLSVSFWFFWMISFCLYNIVREKNKGNL